MSYIYLPGHKVLDPAQSVINDAVGNLAKEYSTPVSANYFSDTMKRLGIKEPELYSSTFLGLNFTHSKQVFVCEKDYLSLKLFFELRDQSQKHPVSNISGKQYFLWLKPILVLTHQSLENTGQRFSNVFDEDSLSDSVQYWIKYTSCSDLIGCLVSELWKRKPAIPVLLALNEPLETALDISLAQDGKSKGQWVLTTRADIEEFRV